MRGPDGPSAEQASEMPEEGVFPLVRDGYDAVYDVLERSPTFAQLWRTNAYHADFPVEFAHISFLTLGEATQLARRLRLATGSLLVDAACGAGGPGLWMARESGATLIGIDPAEAGLVAARRLARQSGLGERARFQLGTFQHTGVADATADAVMTVEALQYAPDKRAALIELRRILRPGGRLGIVCFEVDPGLVLGVPALGTDPIADYRELLRQCEFTVEVYEETPGWQERVYGAFKALVDAQGALVEEMGEQAAAAVLAEATFTIEVRPYPRRILAVARATPL